MSSAPALASIEFAFIQRHLIPPESKVVRYCMHQAATFGKEGGIITSRLYSVPFVVVAIALSALNVLSYTLQIPVKILLNVVRLNPVRLVSDSMLDVTDVSRSLVFAALGLAFILSGILFPHKIFPAFAPDSIDAGEERLKRENRALKKEIAELKASHAAALAAIRDQENRLDGKGFFRSCLPW